MPSEDAKKSPATRLEDRTRRIGPGAYVWRQGEEPSFQERQGIVAMIADLDGRLSNRVPNTGGRIVEGAILQLIDAFKGRIDPSQIEGVYDSFLIALPGLSMPAVSEAVRLCLSGLAPQFSPTFVPTSAELAIFVREIESGWRLERDRLRRLLNIEVDTVTAIEDCSSDPQPLSEADARRLAEWREKMRSGAGGLKRMPEDRPVPLHGPSPAARVAAETASRKAARDAARGRE